MFDSESWHRDGSPAAQRQSESDSNLKRLNLNDSEPLMSRHGPAARVVTGTVPAAQNISCGSGPPLIPAVFRRFKIESISHGTRLARGGHRQDPTRSGPRVVRAGVASIRACAGVRRRTVQSSGAPPR